MKQNTAASWVHVDQLQPWDRNPRHNDNAAKELASAISEYGFTAPLVVQEGTNRIIAGHTRQKAVRMLLAKDPSWTAPGAPDVGMVPARFIDVSDEVATRLTIADNRLGDIATWDEAELSELLQELDTGGLENLGFDEHELSALLGLWEDPFADMEDSASDVFEVEDEGVAKILVVMKIPRAQDAAQAMHDALQSIGLKATEYKLTVV